MKKLSIGGALQNTVGAKMGPQIDQVAPTNSKKASVHLAFGVLEPTRETLKHAETPSGLGLRFICVYILGAMFALSNFKGTVTNKYMIIMFCDCLFVSYVCEVFLHLYYFV